MPIKAVTFDFWQTLVEDSPRNMAKQRARRVDAIAAILRRAGCPLSRRKVEAADEMAEAVPADAAVRPLHTAQVLVGHALDGGGHDNVTVAVLPFPAPSQGAGSA